MITFMIFRFANIVVFEGFSIAVLLDIIFAEKFIEILK